jgi:hypothetical protein
MGRIERVPLIPKKNNKKERASEDNREDEKKCFRSCLCL